MLSRLSQGEDDSMVLRRMLPGVGPERAARLLDRFGSVETAITASSSELQSVVGIGESIADKIRWVVSEEMKRSFKYESC